MKHEALRERVCAANLEIHRAQLAILTWGNASEVDRAAGVFAIKPSGVAYDALTPETMVVISLETGKAVEGCMNPSSDTDTHWQLYQAFAAVGGIVHTHSPCATAWAQAYREIPCLGTTHADTFYGSVPCTRALQESEVAVDYERNTGRVIESHFQQAGLNAMAVPGVLVGGHGPFTWAANAMAAVTHARILEEVAKMAATTLALNPGVQPVDAYLLDKHYFRKHGSNATYGQLS